MSLGCFLVAGLAAVAFSQDYPTKTITMEVGMEPGGIVDVATRVLSEETKKVLGQDILIENKPGASHMVAGSYVVASKPDGYILFSATDAPFIRVPHMLKLKFDPIAETTPIIFYGIFTHFIVVPADSPFKTLKDMLTFAKQNPEKLTFGNPGFWDGSSPDDGRDGTRNGIEDFPIFHLPVNPKRSRPSWAAI